MLQTPVYGRRDLRQNGFDGIGEMRMRGDKHCTGAPGQKYGTGAAAGLALTARRPVRRVKMMAWSFIFLDSRRWMKDRMDTWNVGFSTGDIDLDAKREMTIHFVSFFHGEGT